MRTASQTTLCAAARSAATATRITTDSVDAEVRSATAVLTSMPSRTHSRVRARAAYGRPWAYRAHSAPAEV
ncbi:hypothetical protein NE235_35805 [Actinoallomurus spadix]|uniref:hypothetical protein n=1 Tax=Actinoallomurus spadix TaxID=79912 RepID=UPI00209389C0|nr:hypothetical protein [Actinoallomurus spadix]MCO5991494.1 hypothetical protein [Actinoallomurus spadix]